MKVLLTGESGFIGRHLLAALIQAGHEVVPAVRRPEETDRLLPNDRRQARLYFVRPLAWAAGALLVLVAVFAAEAG